MPKWREGGLKDCVCMETVGGGVTAVGPHRNLVASGKRMISKTLRAGVRHFVFDG